MRKATPLLIAAAILFSALPAHASDYETAFQTKINIERTTRGIAPLIFDSSLIDVARKHSADMAAAGRIFHNADLPNEVSGWLRLGENVGVGQTVDAIHDAFMASTVHREQILSTGYRGFAVGVVQSGPDLYVTELFILRATTVSAPAPKPVRPRVSAPRPAPVAAASAVQPPPASPAVEAATFEPENDHSYKAVLETVPTHQTVAIDFPKLVSVKPRYPMPLTAALTLLLIAVLAHLLRLTRSRQ